MKPSRWEWITTHDNKQLHVNWRACLRGSRWQRYWYGVVAYYIHEARRWRKRAWEAEDGDWMFLNRLADDDTCDGDCDLNRPWKKCPACRAREALNDAGETMAEAVGDIKSR